MFFKLKTSNRLTLHCGTGKRYAKMFCACIFSITEPTHVDINTTVELLIPAVTSKDIVYSFQKNTSDGYFVINSTLFQYDGSSNDTIVVSGSGPYLGSRSSPSTTFQQRDISSNKHLIFTENIIWLKIMSSAHKFVFFGTLSVAGVTGNSLFCIFPVVYCDCSNNLRNLT